MTFTPPNMIRFVPGFASPEVTKEIRVAIGAVDVRDITLKVVSTDTVYVFVKDNLIATKVCAKEKGDETKRFVVSRKIQYSLES